MTHERALVHVSVGTVVASGREGAPHSRPDVTQDGYDLCGSPEWHPRAGPDALLTW
jgi:hypothetical protein